MSAIYCRKFGHVAFLCVAGVSKFWWSKMTAHFNPPPIQDNPTGWGPSSVPDQFKDMPYQPFSKGDPIGKV